MSGFRPCPSVNRIYIKKIKSPDYIQIYFSDVIAFTVDIEDFYTNHSHSQHIVSNINAKSDIAIKKLFYWVMNKYKCNFGHN